MSWGSLSKYRSEIMGIACLWIMLHHNFFDWPTALEPLERFALYGNLGVDLFLLLSGVGLTFAWARKPSLSEFYARRFIRLLVPYVLLAVPYWCWKDLHLGNGNFWLDVFQLSFPLDGVITTWYIPATAVFYLLYPAIARFLDSGDRWSRALLLCGVLMYCCLTLHYRHDPLYRNCEIGLTRFGIFLIGCALGQTVRESFAIPSHFPTLALLWVMLNDSLRRHVSIGDVWIRFSYIPLCLSVCVLLLWALERLDGHQPLRRLLCFFGDRSLELYLTHVLLRNVWLHYHPRMLLDPWGLIPYGLLLLLSTAVSAAVHPLCQRICRHLLPAARKERI